jgi:hypothetical protein
MEALANVDWLTLVLGIILGIPVAYVIGVLAHMHTPKFVHYLESRKLLKTHKTRQQAIAVFNRVRSFHDGRRDRYAFYIICAVGSVLSGLVATICFTVFFNQVHDIPISIDYAFFLLLAVVGTLVAVILLEGIYETARQLERFNDYKAEFEARWGAVDDDAPTASS